MTLHCRSQVREAAEAVAAVAAAEAMAADAEGRFAELALAQLRSSGLLGIFAVTSEPERSDAPIVEYSQVSRVLGRSSMSVALIWMMHSQQVLTIGRYGSKELREKVFESLRAGDTYIASVTTESDSGGDLFTSTAALYSDGDQAIRVQRHAPIVTGGLFADSFLIKMRSPSSDTPRDTVLVYAERNDLTVTPGRAWDMLGMRSTGNIALSLEGTVPRTNQLPVPMSEITVASFAPLAHIGWASAWLGCAEGAWARVLRWTRTRARQHRGFLESDAVLEEIGLIRENLEIVAACLGACVARLADTAAGDAVSPADQIHLNVLKTVAGRNCYAAVEKMIELVGLSDGYTRDSDLGLERALRDLRAASLMYADRRLRKSTGALGLLDRNVSLIFPCD